MTDPGTVSPVRLAPPEDEDLCGVRILVADDVDMNREIARELLEDAGARVTLAHDGYEAVRAVSTSNFDVVIMDVMMPGLDGYEATKRIRSEPRFAQLRIIALTGQDTDEDRERCLAAGMNGHIPKPLHARRLLTTVSAHVREALATRPVRALPTLDLEDALVQMSGNMEALRSLLHIFLRDHGQITQDLRHLLAERQHDEAARKLHRLIGVAGNLRLLALREAAIVLREHLVREAPADELQRPMVDIEVALREARDRIQTLPSGPLVDVVGDNSLPACERGPCVRGTILVVDDDESNRAFLRRSLQRRGHQVIEVDNGYDALQAVREEPIDAILLDVVMPGIDGFEVCRRLKADAATEIIPVLLVTALDTREDRLRGMQAGADDFINKPVDLTEMTLRVNNAVRSKRIHDEVKQNYRQLQRLEQLRDSLTQMLVHDLRTPLTGIVGYAQLLERSAKDRLKPTETEFLSLLHELSRNLIEMVTSILDVSRLEADEMPLAMQPLELGRLVAESVNSLGGLPDGKHIELDCDPTCVAQGDGPLLRRVVANLLSNAIKYTPRNGTVRVVLRPVEGQVELRVIDKGQGIPADQLERVFEKYAQAEAAAERKPHSSGIGLSFCKLVIDKHGGRIGVDSVVGEGSEFWVRLPPATIETTYVAPDGWSQLDSWSVESLRESHGRLKDARQRAMPRLRAAIVARHCEALSEGLRMLEDALRALGARRALATLERLETVAAAGDWFDADEARKNLEGDIDALLTAVDDEMARRARTEVARRA